MRIVGGARRGLRLAEPGPGDPAARLRPTSDRAREALFNLLAHGPYGDPVTGARALDLFAGTGALGLEALSRGAVHVAFVETGRPALALIAENVRRLGAGGEIEVIAADATRLGRRAGAAFDLVLLDPPYGRGLGEKALAAAAAGGWLAPGALVAWEEDGPAAAPAGFAPLDVRRYGAATLTLLRAA